jgi:hypothetical protein
MDVKHGAQGHNETPQLATPECNIGPI